MPASFIEHITLDIGHSRRSPRSLVADVAVFGTQMLLEQALRGGEAGPLQDACVFDAEAHGQCLIATVYGPRDKHGVRTPLVTIGVAGHSRCGIKTWQRLHDDCFRGPLPPLATDREIVPPEPWCAERFEIGLLTFPWFRLWLPDFERCLAWAWLERRKPD